MRLNNKNTGFTLIEIIVSMNICTFILIIAITMFCNLYKDNNKSDEEYSNLLDLKNLTNFIQGQSYMNDLVDLNVIGEDGNILQFIFKEDLNSSKYIEKKIYLKNKKIVVETRSFNGIGISRNLNYMVDNIEEFIIKEKESLIYIKIKSTDLKEENLCIVKRGIYY